MYKYPIKPDESEKHRYITIAEAYKWMNNAFYQGFTAAVIDTRENYLELGPDGRIAIAFAACEKAAIVGGWPAPEIPDFSEDAAELEPVREGG